MALIKLKGLAGLSLLFISTFTLAGYDGPELGERAFKIVNEHNVNMSSGTISYVLNDLSIGYGDLGLTHSISINSNDAMNYSSLVPGPKDKFRGGIRVVRYSKKPGTAYNYFKAISVFDHESTYYFTINEQGKFEGLKNQLVTLTSEGTDTYLLTKTDGTEVRFAAEGAIPSNGIFADYFEPTGFMREIKKPNGHTITIHRKGPNPYLGQAITSVNTNNGLQLKYVYEENILPLDPDKINSTNNPRFNVGPQNWWPYHPVKIIAMNNAIEACDLNSISCTPTNEWPEANYSWENGMPRAFLIGESEFTVTDAMGKQTVFHHKAMSESKQFGDSGFEVHPGLKNQFYPAIVKITESNGNEIDYKYHNISTNTNTCVSSPYAYDGTAVRAGDVADSEKSSGPNPGPPVFGLGLCPTITTLVTIGALRASENNGVIINYMPIGPHAHARDLERERVSVHYSGSTKIVSSHTVYSPSKIANNAYIIDTPTKKVTLTKDFANQVVTIENKLNDTTKDFYYDYKGRVVSVNDAGRVKSFIYNVYYCNPKTCNRPSAVSDGHNTWLGDAPLYTHYYYRSTTGQVALVRKPAVSGKVPAVRYYYGNKYARYKKDNASIQNAATPISLLTRKIHCKDSSLTVASCSGGDKVTTTYNYGTGTSANNLFLIGETMTTQGENEVYRTCYKYDKYGNQIGITQPKAGVADCNIGGEY
jgi:hypothetical protein